MRARQLGEVPECGRAFGPALDIVRTGSGSASITRSHASATSAARRSGSGSARATSTTRGSYPGRAADTAPRSRRGDRARGRRRRSRGRPGRPAAARRSPPRPRRPLVRRFRPSAPSPVRARGRPLRGGAGAGRAACRPRRGSPPRPELPVPSDQLPGDQARALGQRPVVRDATDQVARVLEGLGSRAKGLRAALEVDLVAPDPAREARRCGGAPHVRRRDT
jgi:hypothetical protein